MSTSDIIAAAAAISNVVMAGAAVFALYVASASNKAAAKQFNDTMDAATTLAENTSNAIKESVGRLEAALLSAAAESKAALALHAQTTKPATGPHRSQQY
jgi:lipopolysaccharide export LptBFGC system permease protein LptF